MELETWHAATYLRAYTNRDRKHRTYGESLCYCPKGGREGQKKETGWKDRQERVQSVAFAESSLATAKIKKHGCESRRGGA